MKTATRVGAITVAGAIGLGSLALMSPAVAQTLRAPLAAVSDSPGGGYGQGRGMGAGMGYGARGGGTDVDGMHGRGLGRGMMGTGDCAGLSITADKGSLTEAQRTTLVGLAQEE